MARRIFYWFGASILFTVVLAGLVTWGLESMMPSRWNGETNGLAQHLSRQFVQVWNDGARRDAYARELSQDFNLNVVVEDTSGRVVVEAGEACHEHHRFVVPLTKDGHAFGSVALCSSEEHTAGILKLVMVLALVGFVLWGASLVIARRITRPLEAVAAVADGFGRGDLGRRTGHTEHRTVEVAVLARAIDEMATRIQRQLGDQRELLAAVSHELRTPLGHLRVLIELARERQGDKQKMTKAFGDMESEIAELDRLVAELLASSKLDFGVEHPKRLDAKDVARRALERSSIAADKLTAADGVFLEADATLLARALANLLDNAVRHGGGVSAFVVEQRLDRVVFIVDDDGPGVPEQDLERIFAPLQRGSTGNGSLGLGLALVARIAEAHGGRVTVENRTEGGARFSMSLPTSAPQR